MNFYIQQKYLLYLKEYYKIETIDIKDKNYKTTLFRGLVMYYLYQERQRGRHITLYDIAGAFGLRSHSTIKYAIEQAELYICNPHLLKKNYQMGYIYLMYRFNKILNKNEINHC